MISDMKVGGKYSYRGMIVILKHLAGNQATCAPEGSSHVLIVEANELAPVPKKSELLSNAMRVAESDWHRATELEKALRDANTAARGSRASAIEAVTKKFVISGRTAYNYLKHLRRNPSPHALLRARSGRKLGSRLLDDAREKIIRVAIETSYLQPERQTIARVHGDIKIACEKAGLPPPSAGTVRARVRAIDTETLIKRREGRKSAQETCKPVPDHVKVARPLERIEVDHTLADIMLVSNTKPRVLLGRPWITLVIDCFSRMIIGFYVGFEHPSSTSVAFALAHAFLPKDEWLRRLGVPGTWPAHGFPEAIFVDNALEFRALALRRGCETYQVKLCYRPPGEPQFGGMIERLVGTVMGSVHLLPGTTQSNVRKRGDYDSEGRAQLTLREFITWLTTEIVARYHTTTHRGIGKPPLIAWNQAFEGVDRTPPGVPLDVLANFLPGSKRVLSRTGVAMHRLSYWSNAFSSWVGQKQSVVVHDYPIDPDHVYVRLPNGELTVANVKSVRDVAQKTVADHLLQLSEDRKLQDAPSLRQMRHDGNALQNEILSTSRQAKNSRRKDSSTTSSGEQVAPVRLYRPTSIPALTVHIDDWSIQ